VEEYLPLAPHSASRAYAYKIYYVNYICSLNVEKLITPAPPLSKAQPLSHLEP